MLELNIAKIMKIIVENVTPGSFDSLKLLGFFIFLFICWLVCFIFLLRHAKNFVIGFR